MKKLNVTFAAQPHQSDESCIRETMLGISACHMAFSFDISPTRVPDGLGQILTGPARTRIACEVEDCNRMVAFVTLINEGALVEITFSAQKRVAKRLMLTCQHELGWTLISES